MTEKAKELVKELKFEEKKEKYDVCAEEFAIIVESFEKQGFTREEAISIICACGASNKG